MTRTEVSEAVVEAVIASGYSKVHDDVLAQRFFNKVKIGDSECWLWHGCLIWNGYGHFKVWGDLQLAHRFAYEYFVAPIPVGLVIDHLCRVHNCVNPAHMECVTPQENNLRGQGVAAKNKRKTYCPKGHPYNETNTYIWKDGLRRCKACRNARGKAWRAKERLQKRESVS